jgi:hypothetical protein
VAHYAAKILQMPQPIGSKIEGMMQEPLHLTKLEHGFLVDGYLQ